MKKNKTKIVTIASLLALVMLIIGATYAYFAAQTGEGSQTDIRINANTVDTLTFETGNPITLTLDQENFAQGTGNQTGSTFAKAMLTANNKTNTVTEHYYLYLNISNNTFTYSIDNNIPEILLSIKDSSNNEITSVSGLTYKTVTDGKGASIKGFDITKKSGLITILNNREITTTSTKTEEWNVTVTFVNYNSNQAGNAGKNFTAKLMIQKEEFKESVATVCSNGQTLSSCIIAMDGKDDTLYHHTSSLANGAGDNSYRYAGPSDSVNNFVCFGTNESPCPTDNLYRIIGVIDGKVKLIKYDYASNTLLGTDGDYSADAATAGMPTDNYKGTKEMSDIGVYYWNYKADTRNYNNTWSTSLLNQTNLNTNFLNNVGEKWSNKIATTTWRVGGAKDDFTTPSEAYQNERLNNTMEYETKKIGLMYVTDYGYAATPSDWTIIIGAITNNNWMYMGGTEWTVTRVTTDSDNVFCVFSDGLVDLGSVDLEFAIRIVFNLESSVTYVSGSGSMSDPIIIN